MKEPAPPPLERKFVVLNCLFACKIELSSKFVVKFSFPFLFCCLSSLCSYMFLHDLKHWNNNNDDFISLL